MPSVSRTVASTRSSPDCTTSPRSLRCRGRAQLTLSWRNLDFCSNAVYYDPAIPDISGLTTSEVVRQQDDAAATQFFYHLSALGYEAWEHNDPAHDDGDECVQASGGWCATPTSPRPRLAAPRG
ncbi:unnamed protein product [Prorocentrum cordatum]|uniref:Uncharacterized protein n=1 Tax=Prorocentrum cordatum TaxID=2364126 RepID=A0ABN9Q697_9DINO|nr:unnamed protein product [Polarella glacialis]